MTAMAQQRRSVGLLRHSAWDGLFVGLAAVHGAVLVLIPHPITIAVGIWWNSNTISHGFIHNPFFRNQRLNRIFAVYLSVLLGFPHALWRARHLDHHAGRAARVVWTAEMLMQTILILVLWAVLLFNAPWFFVTAYLPGFGIGMLLCALQGHYEHDEGTRSYYGRLYNLFFFNDGYHVEHHAHPRQHWTRLTRTAQLRQTSSWPPVLRWLEAISLESLERLVLRSRWLQGYVLRCHERAFERVLQDVTEVERIGIVGGGLFPRSAIILSKQMPAARVLVIDFNKENLAAAAEFLPGEVTVTNEVFDRSRHNEFDMLVFPLSLQGDRRTIYDHPPAPLVVVHDWLWNPRGNSSVVSWFLLKRINLVRS